jgi:hypothetical protein
MNSISDAFRLAAQSSQEARELIKAHEARETVREVRRQQAAWWRWRERQQPTKA